ncbi:FtsJ-like methyltransferase-domain-containing protein [Dunaliella salina]|uniref:Cap-specific mRNA (nucleoside-2'-O-)-methyltransferase 2 n=1 Tax=Dunaliella salina TaxID=3046 RepID=A0ABQ7GWL8_DUNSA|nr:FtsJ-like methyltransferase-domain-containing protein [Dunaliella salina]|eukprot:KAF5839008.1 FtsJ-like methyltransferase-domain-containing protein [Dunaliella salina]
MLTGKSFRNLSEEEKAQQQLYGRTVALDNRECRLPCPLTPALFRSPPWEVPRLMQAKQELNSTKDKLDSVDIGVWGKHTFFTNRAGSVVPKLRDTVQPEMCTIAWAKMYEMLVFQDLLPAGSPAAAQSSPGAPPNVFTLHLCEAPGAFVCATNHFIKVERPSWNWDWRAMTLNPYYEGNDQGAMIDDDALIRATMDKWLFGRDNSGDIRKKENIEDVWRRCHEVCAEMGTDGAIMVTADGSVDCQEDPNEQERHTAPLHYCELVTALGMLAHGGSFVLKAFTLLEHPSLCTLYLMGCLFDHVAVTKPSPSKPGNSETYVIGKGYRGASPDLLSLLLHHVSTEDMFTSKAMLSREVLGSASFMRSAEEAASAFAAVQRDIIEENLQLYADFPKWRKGALCQAKDMLACQWMYDTQLMTDSGAKTVDPSQFLAPEVTLSGRDNNTSHAVTGGIKRKAEGTLDERRRFYEQRRKTQQGGMPGGGGGPGAVGNTAKTSANLGEEGAGEGGLEETEAGGPSGPAPFQPNDKVAKIMEKMGHKEGKGLGREGQGITQPVKNTGEGKLKKGLGYQASDAGDPLHGLGGGGGQRPATEAIPDTALLCNDQPLTELQSRQGWNVVLLTYLHDLCTCLTYAHAQPVHLQDLYTLDGFAVPGGMECGGAAVLHDLCSWRDLCSPRRSCSPGRKKVECGGAAVLHNLPV